MKFKVYLEYDPEYEGFIADIPTLPGCMSQGKTEKEALENIKEAAVLYIHTRDNRAVLQKDISARAKNMNIQSENDIERMIDSARS